MTLHHTKHAHYYEKYHTAISILPATAADDDDAPKFSVKPTGRILMDGAVYMGGNGNIQEDEDTRFVDGVAIPDLRLGVKASYGKWKAKVDVGFGYGKVGLKDTSTPPTSCAWDISSRNGDSTPRRAHL